MTGPYARIDHADEGSDDQPGLFPLAGLDAWHTPESGTPQAPGVPSAASAPLAGESGDRDAQARRTPPIRWADVQAVLNDLCQADSVKAFLRARERARALCGWREP